MTLAIGWLHDGGETAGSWLHEPGDWQSRRRANAARERWVRAYAPRHVLRAMTHAARAPSRFRSWREDC
jgi:hypothetical protein